jgi:biotin synthase
MAQRILKQSVGLALVPRAQLRSRGFSTVSDAPIDPRTQQIGPTVARRASSVYEDALNATTPRTNWTKDEISEIYNTSLIDLTYASVC